MTTIPYNVIVALTKPMGDLTTDDRDHLADAFDGFTPLLGPGRNGNAHVTFTLRADSVAQATRLALSLMDSVSVVPEALEVLTFDEFNRWGGRALATIDADDPDEGQVAPRERFSPASARCPSRSRWRGASPRSWRTPPTTPRPTSRCGGRRSTC